MNTPDFRFTLISNLDKINNLGSVGAPWISANGGEDNPWTNGTGKIQCIAPAGTLSHVLYRNDMAWVAGKKYLVFITYTSITDCQFVVNSDYGTGPQDRQDLYLLNVKGQGSPRLLTCSIIGQPNQGAAFALYVVNAIGGINFSFSQILVQEVDSLTRVVKPGGWKGLTKNLERIPKYWGFVETLEGSIDLFGDDLAWLKSFVKTRPDKRFKCLVEISVGGGAFEIFYNGLLDIVSLTSTGIGRPQDISTYKASIPFLKETEWSRFIGNIDNAMDFTSNKDVLNLDVIDTRGDVEEISPPSGFPPRLTMLFTGQIPETFPQFSVQVAADEINNIGFGNLTTINDGFDSYNGVSKQDTISLSVGKMVALSGTITLNYTPIGNVFVEAQLTSVGVWTVIPDGVPTTENAPLGSLGGGITGWSIRVRNNSGAQRTILFDPNSIQTLAISALVEYTLNPYGISPLLFLKGYFTRMLGDYDNLRCPIFETNSFGIAVGVEGTAPLQNPPPRFRPYNAATGVVQDVPNGNVFIGGDANWVQSGGNLTMTTFNVSNMLLMRIGHGAYYIYTTYLTKGKYKMTVIIVNPGTNPFGYLQFVGTIGDEIVPFDILYTSAAGTFEVLLSLDRLYDGIGVVAHDVQGLVVSVFILSVNNPDHGIVRGKYALNSISNGLELNKEVDIIIPPISTKSQYREPSKGINGLISIFGLGMEAVLLPDGRPQMYIDELDKFFTNASLPTLFTEEFEIGLDDDIVKDKISVGGPSQQDNPVDQDSSCSISSFASTYITTRGEYELRFEICLNSAMILNRKLDNVDLWMAELSTRSLPGVVGVTTYRTSNGLSIVGSPSPQQLNWLHSEGRILRRSIGVVSSMGSEVFNLTGGVASTQVSVDAGDGLGSIADATPIFPAALFTPYLIRFETAMTYEEYKTFFTNRRSTRKVTIENIERTFHTKSNRYNASSGRAVISGWLTNAGDFSDDFSDDFDNEASPLVLGEFSDDFNDDFDNVAINSNI